MKCESSSLLFKVSKWLGVRDMGLIPGSGRSSGEGHSNPLQYSHGQRSLENPMDRGAWRSAVHAVAELNTTEVTWHARMHMRHTLNSHQKLTLQNIHQNLTAFRIVRNKFLQFKPLSQWYFVTAA
ncbi:unnamed protein product [Rangifer tarandus platyrhynchus]|uniref:Uncharacterized protein n=1 Tax=Rangifer tarandus platyrhynchus TaxID=3082113 RepID=A0ABN8ZAG5_RANTA|nr:unnamed protein product [Rangifer tarandus platyrhynchus]